MRVHFNICLFTVLILIAIKSSCQDVSNNSTIPDLLHGIDRQYLNSIGLSTRLFYGFEYVHDYRAISGSPFFMFSSFEKGTVWCSGICYKDVSLKYDLVNGELVVLGLKNENICLVKEKVDSFDIRQYHFIKCAIDDSQVDKDEYRFSQVVFRGNRVLFLVKSQLIVKPALHAEDPSTFVLYKSYYLVLNNKEFKINGKQDLKKLLDSNDGQMKVFWRDNSSDFKKNMEETIRQASVFYDHIKK